MYPLIANAWLITTVFTHNFWHLIIGLAWLALSIASDYQEYKQKELLQNIITEKAKQELEKLIK